MTHPGDPQGLKAANVKNPGKFKEELNDVEIGSPQPKSRSQRNSIKTRDNRLGSHQKGILKSRKTLMEAWHQIWSINGFLNPWLSDYIKVFFHSNFPRGLGRATPWLLIVFDLLFAALVGMTGSGWTKIVWEGNDVIEQLEWYSTSEGNKLGGWGYCSEGKKCVMEPLYNIPSKERPGGILFSTLSLSSLILSVGIAGICLILGTSWVILVRLTSNSSSFRDFACVGCVESAINHVERRPDIIEDVDEDEEERVKEPWMIFLDWVMWGFMIWIIVAFVGLKAWGSMVNSEELMGDTIMTLLFGTSMSWILILLVYRSKWAAVRPTDSMRDDGRKRNDR